MLYENVGDMKCHGYILFTWYFPVMMMCMCGWRMTRFFGAFLFNLSECWLCLNSPQPTATRVRRVANSENINNQITSSELPSIFQFSIAPHSPDDQPINDDLITSTMEVMFSPGFVCGFVCEQDNSKTYGRILMKFSGYV